MNKHKSSTTFISLIKIGLIFYTMVRSIDLVMSTMPESIKLFAIAVVFGLDLALLAWDNYTADPYKARSDAQHNVGVIMIVANMLGIGAAMVADSMRVLDPIGSHDTINIVSIFVISGVVLSNIAALIAVNQLDPDRAEAQAQAAHDRELARMEKEHDRQLQLDDKRTELDIASYKNRQRIKAARQKFYLPDDDHNGRPDIVDAAERGDMNALRQQLEAAIEALNHTAAKSPNGHIMASDGVEAPKVTER